MKKMIESTRRKFEWARIYICGTGPKTRRFHRKKTELPKPPQQPQGNLEKGRFGGRPTAPPLPRYPDSRFEADLRTFLKTHWPDTPFKSEVEAAARAAFYESFRPHVDIANLPSGITISANAFAKKKFMERGLHKWYPFHIRVQIQGMY